MSVAGAIQALRLSEEDERAIEHHFGLDLADLFETIGDRFYQAPNQASPANPAITEFARDYDFPEDEEENAADLLLMARLRDWVADRRAAR